MPSHEPTDKQEAGNQIEVTIDNGNWGAFGSWRKSNGPSGSIDVPSQGSRSALATELETNPKYFPPELKAIAFQVIQDLLNLREGEDRRTARSVSRMARVEDPATKSEMRHS